MGTGSISPGSQGFFQRFGIITGAIGVAGIASLGLFSNSDVREWVAGLAMAALALAVGSGSASALGKTSAVAPTPARSWRTAALAAAPVLIAAAAAQSWFTWGRSLAGGDIAPPEGTAWISRLFLPWTWTGSNLGGPNASETQLPWAVVLGATHALGLPAWFAQRLWLTLLFAAAAAAAVVLLRTLGLRPTGAGAGALVYIFNPYVLSTVGINAVYLAGLVVLAALPAAVLSAANRRLSVLAASIAVAVLGPLMGYVYANPPLAAMAAGAAAFAVPLAGWLWGWHAARRALVAVVLGGLAAILVSLYWITPSLLQISAVATGNLSPVSAWAWTEGRATLANGLWLNTAWGWVYSIYYPYANAYGHWPLQLVKYLLPAASFGGLVLALARRNRPRVRYLTRLALAAAAVSLFFIFLATGTNPPGSILFDALYALPYGWLLREPGRFLMVVGLGYAVMFGVTIEVAGPTLVFRAAHYLTTWRSHARQWRLARPVGAALLGAILMVALVPAYPLALGQVAPAQRRGYFPSSRVAFPHYWTLMADYLNSKAPPGHLLVLPPDDFYQMPYTWGYYGNDGFISALLNRDVLDPTAQGYDSVASQLTATDQSLVSALLRRKWALATTLMTVLGTPLILVRGDVDASFPGRDIVSPAELAARLLADPAMRLVRHAGPLELFDENGASPSPTIVTSSVVTVNSPAPDLSSLVVLPPHSALVTAPMRPGTPAILQAPQFSAWRMVRGELESAINAPAGWRYRLLFLPSKGGVVARGPVSASFTEGNAVLRLKLGRQAAVDGSLHSGPWQPAVGNCDDLGGRIASRDLQASVVSGPDGRLALKLQASTDSACEATPIAWRGGPLLLSLWIRHESGANPRLCLWESALHRCSAQTPTLPGARGWRHIQFVLQPNSAAGALSLFVYADSLTPGQSTTNEYADLGAYSLPAVGEAVLLATPIRPSRTPERLLVTDSSFSSRWSAPVGKHVLVDGLRNGWLLPLGESGVVLPTYLPAASLHVSRIVSAVAGAFALLMLAGLLLSGARRKLNHTRRKAGVQR